jgi:heme/copper-type cytochrome/quinol oxidase subunit 2
VMTCLMILPIVLLVSGLVGTIVVVVRKKRQTPAQ